MGEDLGGGLETAAGRLQGPLVLRVALRRLKLAFAVLCWILTASEAYGQSLHCSEYTLTLDSLILGLDCSSERPPEEYAIVGKKKYEFREKGYRLVKRKYKDGYVFGTDSVLHDYAMKSFPHMVNYSHVVSIYILAFISESGSIDGLYCMFPFHHKIECVYRGELMKLIPARVDGLFERHFSFRTVQVRNVRLN